MNSGAAARLPVRALRGLVVLPGACVEGALAVALPWTLAQALLGSAWLGAASAGLVLAAATGTLVAPVLERALGNRRMTVLAAFVVAVALGAAAWSWVWPQPLLAYGFVLLAIAADAACDLGFSARMPLLARLAAQRLELFSGANWLWGIGGAAIGSLVAGWAVAAKHIAELVFGLVLLSLLVAIALAVVLPREPRRRVALQPVFQLLRDRRLWTPAVVKMSAVLTVLFFFIGPFDSLLVPAHLASSNLPSSLFGNMLAALGLGLAAGLGWMQWSVSARVPDVDPASASAPTGHKRVVAGLLGLAGQMALMLWLPPQWLLLTGLFTCAFLFAPMLPILEAKMLTAAPSGQRTLVLAAMSTLVGVADGLGALSMGALISWSSTAMTLVVCLGAVCLAAAAFSVWPRR